MYHTVTTKISGELQNFFLITGYKYVMSLGICWPVVPSFYRHTQLVKELNAAVTLYTGGSLAKAYRVQISVKLTVAPRMLVVIFRPYKKILT
jgi:hypothetical protein